MQQTDKQQPFFSKRDKEIQQDALTLRGTLCMPVDNAPTITLLMLAGSGELDRNENGARLQLNIFNEIAHVLAENGIASFRYDKRGCAESDGVYNETGFSILSMMLEPACMPFAISRRPRNQKYYYWATAKVP